MSTSTWVEAITTLHNCGAETRPVSCHFPSEASSVVHRPQPLVMGVDVRLLPALLGSTCTHLSGVYLLRSDAAESYQHRNITVNSAEGGPSLWLGCAGACGVAVACAAVGCR